MGDIYIFDIDGTITGYREAMTADQLSAFLDVATRFPTYLVTGSDRGKLLSQVPQTAVDATLGQFTCSASQLWVEQKLAWQRQHTFCDGLKKFVRARIDESPYAVRTGNHIEERPAALNVSVVGRNADRIEREAYGRYDREHGERNALAQSIRDAFPAYDVYRGGQISIDISPKGWNKSQALAHIQKWHPGQTLHFFGDNMSLGGNDRPLCEAILKSTSPGYCYNVNSPDETYRILRQQVRQFTGRDERFQFPEFVRTNLSAVPA